MCIGCTHEMHDEWISHLCMVQALLQIIQVSLRSHNLSPKGTADVIDSFANTLKVGMLALARRPQQTHQLQAKPPWDPCDLCMQHEC